MAIPNDPKSQKTIPPRVNTLTANSLAGNNNPTMARNHNTPDGKPPAFVGRMARMDGNMAASEVANRGYSTQQLASVASKPIPGVNITPDQANYEIARRAAVGLGIEHPDPEKGIHTYRDGAVTGKTRSDADKMRTNEGIKAERAGIAQEIANHQVQDRGIHPQIGTASEGYMPSSNMGATQTRPAITPDDISRHNRAAGVIQVSQNGTAMMPTDDPGKLMPVVRQAPGLPAVADQPSANALAGNAPQKPLALPAPGAPADPATTFRGGQGDGATMYAPGQTPPPQPDAADFNTHNPQSRFDRFQQPANQPNPNVGRGAMSAEAAAWQQDQASRQAAAGQAPIANQSQKVDLNGRPLQPSAPAATPAGTTSTVAGKVKAAADSVKGSMNQAVEKGKTITSGVKNSGLGKGAGALALGATMGDLALTAAGDKQVDKMDQWAQRFGADAPTGDGSIGDMAKTGALAIGGFGTDLADMATGGVLGNLAYRDKTDGKDINEQIRDVGGTLANMGGAAAAYKVADKLTGGKAGKLVTAAKMLAGAGGAAAAGSAYDKLTGEVDWHAQNEADQSAAGSGQQSDQTPQQEERSAAAPQGGSGYMIGKDGKRVDFNPATGTFEGDLLGDRAGKGVVNVGAGGFTKADFERRVAEGYGKDGTKGRPEKGAGAIMIGSSGMESTDERNARLTAESAAEKYGNMSDRAKAELALEHAKMGQDAQWKNSQMGMDAMQLALEAQKANSLMQGNSVDSAVKQSALADSTEARGLRSKIMAETDPQRRAALEEQLSLLTGGSGNRYAAFPMDDGTMGILDKQRGAISPASSLAATM